MTAEMLEQRTLPALTFSVAFDDPGAEQAAFYSGLEQNLLAAGDELSQYLDGTASIEVVIGFADTSLRANGASEHYETIRVEDGITVLQPGAGFEARTGTDPNGVTPDVRINIGIDFLTNDVWLDPTPASDADPIPSDKVDGYTALLHELVHAFGFIGYSSGTDGSLPSTFATLFDEQITFVDGNIYFNGPKAIEVYGGPVPLTFGNNFHVGNSAPRPGSELVATDLMNGVSLDRGMRYSLSPLDLAILADNSVPLLADAEPNNPPIISPQEFDLAEHSPNGTVVGTVVATDIDVGQTRTYAILTGNSNGAFSINPMTGVITVADGTLLEFDNQASIVLSVEVTDNGTPALSSTADVTINLFELTVPQVTTSAGTTTLGKGSVVIIDGSADLESGPDFTSPTGSKVTTTIASGAGTKDKLVVSATGDRSTRLKLKRGELKKGKTAIATATGGSGGTPLTITFLPTASVGDVKLVLKKLALKVSRKDSGTRTVSFQFTLAGGAMSELAMKAVEIP